METALSVAIAVYTVSDDLVLWEFENKQTTTTKKQAVSRLLNKSKYLMYFNEWSVMLYDCIIRAENSCFRNI